MRDSLLKEYYTTPAEIINSTANPGKKSGIGYFDKFNFCFLGLQVCVTTYQGRLAVCVRGWYPQESSVRRQSKKVVYDKEWVPVAFPHNINSASAIFRQYVDEIISMPSERFAMFTQLSSLAFI